MPEKPKKKKDNMTKPDKSSWSEDQKDRGYYYDDSHGYEIYKPEDESNKEKGTTKNDRAK